MKKIKNQNLQSCNGIENSQDYFVTDSIICCNSKAYEMKYIGTLRKSLFGTYYFEPKNDELIICIKCKNCKEQMQLFNSVTDGYDNCVNDSDSQIINYNGFKSFECPKCNHNFFEIIVEREYSNIDELKEMKIENISNYFTWIRITLKCKNCNKVFKNIVNLET
jgi:hypothetical protein